MPPTSPLLHRDRGAFALPRNPIEQRKTEAASAYAIHSSNAVQVESNAGAVILTQSKERRAKVEHSLRFGMGYLFLLTLSRVELSGLSRTYLRPLTLTVCAPG